MIILGVILLIIGGLLDVPNSVDPRPHPVVGGVLWLLGATDHKVGPRRHYW